SDIPGSDGVEAADPLVADDRALIDELPLAAYVARQPESLDSLPRTDMLLQNDPVERELPLQIDLDHRGLHLVRRAPVCIRITVEQRLRSMRPGFSRSGRRRAFGQIEAERLVQHPS